MKLPSSTLLRSSIGLGWSFLSAEHRAHRLYEGPGAAASPDVQVLVVVRGSDEELTYKCAGSWQSARPTTGSIWLMPIGGTCNETHIPAEMEVLHLYLATRGFARLTDDYLPPEPGRFIRHSGGVQDELINQIGLSVLSEMTSPTAAGRMLVETSSLLLAARLAHSHLETELVSPSIPSRHRLDDGRLSRVLAYIEEHLAEEITLSDLANVACLSLFHFARAFAATVGVPPHRYVSRRRLENAKQRIAGGKVSMSEVAFDCGFSSQSSFGRAFRRATGMTPAEYRRKRS
jgi:AraC family transcriptional regulator